MSNKPVKMEDLTEEQKAKVEKLTELFKKKEFQDKILAAETTDEVIAVFEEHGISYTDEEKDQIRKFAEAQRKELEERELTDEELEKIAGGGFWNWLKKSGPVGTICGAAGGFTLALEASYGLWATLAATGIGAGVGLVGIGVTGALLAWAAE